MGKGRIVTRNSLIVNGKRKAKRKKESCPLITQINTDF